MTNSLVSRARLLQLCSANLPVGGFSFSQGLEQAVEIGWVNNVESLENWVSVLLRQSVSHSDIPLLRAQYRSMATQQADDFIQQDDWVAATRETDEILKAERAMGKALNRLLRNLTDKPDGAADTWLTTVSADCFISQFALAAHLFGLDEQDCLVGYVWTLLDNQIAAGTKLIPLGQTDGQNLLFRLSEQIATCVARGLQVSLDEVGMSMPSLAMASAWHEQQYSRLFRS
jgi:urease accessory protein